MKSGIERSAEGARSDADVSVPQLVFRNKRANVNVVHDPAYQRARQQLMKEMMHRVMLQEFPLPPRDLGSGLIRGPPTAED